MATSFYARIPRLFAFLFIGAALFVVLTGCPSAPPMTPPDENVPGDTSGGDQTTEPTPGEDDTTEPTAPAAGDLDGDGQISQADLTAFENQMATLPNFFGSAPGDPAYSEAADLNADGVIGWTDYQLLIQMIEGS